MNEELTYELTYEDKEKIRTDWNKADRGELERLVMDARVLDEAIRARNNKPQLEANEPEMSGNGHFGYNVEVSKDKGVTWEDLGLHRPDPVKVAAGTAPKGISGSFSLGNITSMVGLATWEQAQALAWLRRAEAAENNVCNYRVRVVPYHVTYSIKTKRCEDLMKEEDGPV